LKKEEKKKNLKDRSIEIKQRNDMEKPEIMENAKSGIMLTENESVSDGQGNY
jgi:hypothetical protein